MRAAHWVRTLVVLVYAALLRAPAVFCASVIHILANPCKYKGNLNQKPVDVSAVCHLLGGSIHFHLSVVKRHV